jgi:sugar/nucleoside kinase (ribokinase family)
LGCAAADELIYVESFPKPDGKTPVLRNERHCGGLTATALAAASRLGARCAFGGLLGDGPLSQFVEGTLLGEGVDMTPTARSPDAEPIYATVIVDVTHHTRAILAQYRGRTGADDDLPDAGVIRSTATLFIDHHGSAGNIRAATIAREAGIPVVADFERADVPRFEEMLSLVDHLIVSEAFALSLAQARTVPDAIASLFERTRGTVVVTCGAEGGWGFEPGLSEPFRYPAFHVEAADTTGCGDVFHGAYAAELARGSDLRRRIRVAAASAALKATKPGGQAGIPNRAAVETFLKERGASGE